jgi:membrane protease YdiL (CAAX protease family)
MHENTHNYQKPIPVRTHWTVWICRNQVFAFFVLTFVFSWSIYLVAGLSEFSNQTVLSRVLLIAAFGPSLSAILISTVNSSQSATPMSGKRIVLFLLIFVFGAAIEWLDHILWRHQIDAHLIITDAILITLAAVVISSLYSIRQGVRDMITPITHWRVGISWYFIALGLWPLIILAGNAMAQSLNMTISSSPPWPNRPILFVIAESFLWYFLFGGPLNEEPGWRGFAMPRLQRQFSPLVASVILGALWGLWHVPLHLLGVYYGGAWGAIIRIQEIPRTILFTWIYNRTKGSLLIALLFHTAINTTSLFLPRSFSIVLVICTLIAAIVVIAEKMWKYPQALRFTK